MESVRVYTPSSEYSTAYDTPSQKSTLINGLILFGQRKTFNDAGFSSAAGNDNYLLYTVPAGKTFFLTHATLCIMGGRGLKWIALTNGTTQISTAMYGEGTATTIYGNVAIVCDYVSPLKFVATERLYSNFYRDDTGNSYYTITVNGYELDDTVLKSLV